MIIPLNPVPRLRSKVSNCDVTVEWTQPLFLLIEHHKTISSVRSPVRTITSAQVGAQRVPPVENPSRSPAIYIIEPATGRKPHNSGARKSGPVHRILRRREFGSRNNNFIRVSFNKRRSQQNKGRSGYKRWRFRVRVFTVPCVIALGGWRRPKETRGPCIYQNAPQSCTSRFHDVYSFLILA